MIKKKVIEDIKNKLSNLGWNPIDQDDIRNIERNMQLESSPKDGYVFFINEKKDKENTVNNATCFDGKTYQRKVLIYVLFLENGNIFIDETCSYYVFPYIKDENVLVGKQWTLDKENIDYWTTNNEINNYKNAVYYLNHLTDIDDAWDKEIALMEKFHSLTFDESMQRMEDSLNARLNNEKFEDEFSHMLIEPIDWDEDSRFYAEMWGETPEQIEEYYRIMEQNKRQIPEKR